MSLLRWNAAQVTASFLIASTASPGQFRPFDNARVERIQSGEMRTLIGQDHPLAIIVQRPARGVKLTRYERWQWMFRSRDGARRLCDYLEKITGVEATVQAVEKPPKATDGFRVYVGRNDWGVGQNSALEALDGHGFIVRTLTDLEGQPALWISGPTGAGTAFGVSYFLQNYCGIRWVMQGELGEVVPTQERIEIPEKLDVVHPGPDFLLRIWSGQAGLDRTRWLVDTGSTVRFEYHHNLYRVFPPTKYGETHPDLYPFREGKRHVPVVKDGKYANAAWQICFSYPSAPDLAMEYARDLFERRPDMKSLSLSVNDSHGYCDCEPCRQLSGSSKSGGFRSCSGAYYRFVNQVAVRMQKEFPDKYVAFLPYGFVREPPDFPLEKNVMMFVFGEPRQVLDAWEGKAFSIGYYQWLYGTGWVVCNFWPHALQDCLKMLYARGARAFKGEAYCGWGWGGPKLWALANTLWDRNVDVDAALRDYYEHAYGKEAAPAVEQFFSRWEQIYERRRTAEAFAFTKWHPGDYQFEHVTAADYGKLDGHLREALRCVQGDRNRQRLELVKHALDQGRYFFREFDVVRTLENAEVKALADADSLMALAASYHSYPSQREAHFREHVEPARYDVFFFERKGKMDIGTFYGACGFTYPLRYDGAVDRVFGQITDLLTKDDPQAAEAYWRRVATDTPVLAPYAETQITLLRAHDEPLPNLLKNGSFEQPLAETPKDFMWNWRAYVNRNINAKPDRDDSTAAEGKWSGTVRGAGDIVGFLGSVTLACGGRYRVRLKYLTKQQTGQTRCWFYANTKKGPWRIQKILPPAEAWDSFELTFTAPKVGTRMGAGFGLTAKRQGDNDQAWFDDVRLEELYTPRGTD